jgi:hypothetical protein
VEQCRQGSDRVCGAAVIDDFIGYKHVGSVMADADLDKPSLEFMSALVTEHFVLEGTSSSTISESGSRVSIYLSAPSSGLVAIGFASGSHRALESLAFTVLPTVFMLGCFTIVRLIDTSVANFVAQRRMARITAYTRRCTRPAHPTSRPTTAACGTAGGRCSSRWPAWSSWSTRW